jgi:hypothetical protein
MRTMHPRRLVTPVLMRRIRKAGHGIGALKRRMKLGDAMMRKRIVLGVGARRRPTRQRARVVSMLNMPRGRHANKGMMRK